jgi:integrase
VRQEKLLPGPFGSAESLAAKARLEMELAASPTRQPAVEPRAFTVAQLLDAYLDHAERHYQDADGKPTDELRHVKTVIGYVFGLYAALPVTEFGPLALKAVREKFIGERWCRKTVNARVERVRRIFKWGVSEELVPPTVYQALATVSGLQRGRTTARETAPVEPVEDATIDATLPHLNRHVRGLVEFQRLTGCRPGEACRVRRRDLDMTGDVWLYKPVHHKTAWKGKARTIAIGPKAQELLKQFFTPDWNDYLFSPVRAVEEFRAERSANRKTPRYPSHMARNERKRSTTRKRLPADRYNRRAYINALKRACDRAFPPTGELSRLSGESVAKWWARLNKEQRDAVKVWRKAHRWHPNQLRHTFATHVRKQHGLEVAQVMLGHARADVTQVYAEKNEALAVATALKIG